MTSTTTTTPTPNKENSKEENISSSNYYEDVENLKKLCNFLRSREGPPVREALLMEKRVHYLKGEKIVNFLVEPKKGTKWPTDLPKFDSNNRQYAIDTCKELVRNHFLIKSEKKGKGELGMCRVQNFDETGYYTWFYEGDTTMRYLMTAALIVGFLFCVCFPIWPQFLRIFVWYMSVSFLLFIFGLITSRAFLFLFVWMLGYELWFLPNLFDETLNFVDSFKPIFSFEPTKPGQLPYRIGVAVAFFSFCWWAVTQPSEFDGFVAAQGDFLKDLYAGTLLSDTSQADKENIDKPKVQSLDDLLKSLEEEDDDDTKNNKVSGILDDLESEEHLDSLLDNLVDAEEEDIDEEEE